LPRLRGRRGRHPRGYCLVYDAVVCRAISLRTPLVWLNFLFRLVGATSHSVDGIAHNGKGTQCSISLRSTRPRKRGSAPWS
jgi:hypothetical protein